jgi:hypothetical protein
MPSDAPDVGKLDLKVMVRCGGRDGAAWTESTVASVVIVASWSERKGDGNQAAGEGLQAAAAMARI